MHSWSFGHSSDKNFNQRTGVAKMLLSQLNGNPVVAKNRGVVARSTNFGQCRRPLLQTIISVAEGELLSTSSQHGGIAALRCVSALSASIMSSTDDRFGLNGTSNS